MVMFLALDLVKSVESLCFWGVVSGVASAMHWHQEAARIQHPRGLQHAQSYQRKGFLSITFFFEVYPTGVFLCPTPGIFSSSKRLMSAVCYKIFEDFFFTWKHRKAFRRISQPGGKSNLHWSLVYLVLVRFSWVNRLCASGLYTERGSRSGLLWMAEVTRQNECLCWWMSPGIAGPRSWLLWICPSLPGAVILDASASIDSKLTTSSEFSFQLWDLAWPWIVTRCQGISLSVVCSALHPICPAHPPGLKSGASGPQI